MNQLHVPVVEEMDTLAAALAYAKAGWYVGPLVNGQKNPGSRLGKSWQSQTSRDPEMIVAWFAGSNDGLFLHCGRSGAVVFDIDAPEKLADPLLTALGDTQPPHQSTRDNHPGRGHFLFAFPPGRTLGNGLGKLAGGWGEIRGANGVIVVEPTQHEKADGGGRYKWMRGGEVPVLPEAVAELLNDSKPGEDTATDKEVLAFLDEHVGMARPELLDVWVASFQAKVKEGESRHDRMTSICAGAMAEARAGFYPARLAMERLEAEFMAAVTQPGHGQQGKERSRGIAASEWMGISAWAVAQAKAADLADIRARIDEKMPDPLGWVREMTGDTAPTRTEKVSSGVTEGAEITRSVTSAPRVTPPATTPGMFFDKNTGLMSQVLTQTVLAHGAIAADHGKNLLQYHDGVWDQDGERIVRSRVADLLRDKYRTYHAGTVVDILRNKEPHFSDQRQDTQYLNLPNGLLDWKTGELGPHDPEVPSIIRIPVEWNPDATCPAIDKWMGEVFPDDAKSFIEEVIGYCLYNDNPLHKAVLLFGRGRNGKGTFLRLLTRLIGARNISSVTPQSLDDNRYRAAELYGKLANLVGDVDPRIFKATETFKQITGGDMVTAERKYGQPFMFHCRALMVAAFNELPRTADASEGFFSRWIVVPFTGYFPAGVANPNREHALHTEGEIQGLLVTAVRGLRRLMERREFALPPSVLRETTEFRRHADPVRTWLHEYLEDVVDGTWTNRAEVYRRYHDWTVLNGHHAMAAARFYDRVTSLNDGDFTIESRKRQGMRGLLFMRRNEGEIT